MTIETIPTGRRKITSAKGIKKPITRWQTGKAINSTTKPHITMTTNQATSNHATKNDYSWHHGRKRLCVQINGKSRGKWKTRIMNQPKRQTRNLNPERNQKPMTRSQSWNANKSNIERTRHYSNELNQRIKQHQFKPRQRKRPCAQSNGESRGKWNAGIMKHPKQKTQNIKRQRKHKPMTRSQPGS